METIAEGFIWRFPVATTDVSTIIRWYTATIDNNGEDDKSCAADDLDDGENEFNLAIASNTENLDDDKSNEEDSDPDGLINVACSLPIIERDASCGDLERQNCEPLDCVIPTSCETPGAADEAKIVGEEGTIDRITSPGLARVLYSTGKEHQLTEQQVRRGLAW